MTYYVEVTSDPFKRFCHIIPVDSLHLYKGFRSMYAFNEEAVQYFKELGKVKGLKAFPVIAKTLTIDIDNDEASYHATLAKIKASGYKFEAWESGGKGYHIILFHELVEDINVPYWHRNWVEKRKIPCDLCIYESGRLIRLPHTVHAKTGRPKCLLESQDGKLITLDRVTPQHTLNHSTGEDKDGFGMLAVMLTKLVNSPIEKGERNIRMYSLVRTFYECGFSSGATEEFAELVNEDSEEPLESDELKAVINSITR